MIHNFLMEMIPFQDGK